MKEIIKIISIFLFTSFILTSCTSEDNTPTMEEDSYLVLSNVNDQVWTYFSLSTGTIVGTSAFGSTKVMKNGKSVLIGIWLSVESMYVPIAVPPAMVKGD